MKNRKHANISQLVYAAPISSLQASIILQPHVCQLNQSTWDLSPPPSPPPYSPPSQVKGSGSSTENGSSDGGILATQREFNTCRLSEFPKAMEVEENHEPLSSLPVKKEQVIMRSKKNGKGWQCRREASKSYLLCDHQRYNNNFGHNLTKKYEKTVEEDPPPRHIRPKKAPSSNPNEFYYYSGFGPRWGKQRGETNMNNNRGNAEDYDNMEYNDDVEEEEVGKKRARKPMIARSLKSLM
ncbi:hypothetical protein ACS0TY_016633 [Phlomoides rotata]